MKKWKDEFKTHFILPKFVSKILKFFHTVVEGALISSFDKKAKIKEKVYNREAMPVTVTVTELDPQGISSN